MRTKEDLLVLAAVEERLAEWRDFPEEIKKEKDELMRMIAERRKILHVGLDYKFFYENFGRTPDKRECQGHGISYLAKMRDIFEKNNCEFVFLGGVVHELRKIGKVHHHLFVLFPMGGIKLEELDRIWEYGYVHLKVIDAPKLRECFF